jgi:hypothetical protein
MSLTNNIGNDNKTNKNYIMCSESDLQLHVVKFLKKKNLPYCSTLGEILTTDTLRINAVRSGYSIGIPDLMIYKSTSDFNGLAIELKAPRFPSDVSEVQSRWHQVLIDQGWRVLVSNDFVEIIEEIILYIS